MKLRHPVERALRDADIHPSEIEAVILIGGSTRMPLVRNVVSKMFNKLPYSNINPDEAVALGACIQAALKEKNLELNELILTDVCPYTLGVDVVKHIDAKKYEPGYFLPIIERNSPGSMTEEEIKIRMLELKDIKIHPRDRTENRLVLARGERLYEEALGENREYIENLLVEFERILSTHNPRLIEKNIKILNERLDELETYY